MNEIASAMAEPSDFRAHYIRTMQAMLAAGIRSAGGEASYPAEVMRGERLDTPGMIAPIATDVNTLLSLQIELGMEVSRKPDAAKLGAVSRRSTAEALCLAATHVLTERLMSGSAADLDWARPGDESIAGPPVDGRLFHEEEFVAQALVGGLRWLDDWLEADTSGAIPQPDELATVLAERTT